LIPVHVTVAVLCQLLPGYYQLHNKEQRSARLRSDNSDEFIFWIPKLSIPILEKKKKTPFYGCVGCNWYFFCLLPEFTHLRITCLLTPFSQLNLQHLCWALMAWSKTSTKG